MAVVMGPSNRGVRGRAHERGAQRKVEEGTGKQKKRGEMKICADGGPRSRPKEGQMNREERGKWRGGGVHGWGT